MHWSGIPFAKLSEALIWLDISTPSSVASGLSRTKILL